MFFLKSALRALGVNSNVGWTFLARLASMGAGFVALFPVTHFLTASQQGYYYTFASITALQNLFELGLTQILVQITSHEFPFLPQGASFSELKSNFSGKRLAYFATFSESWYKITSISFTLSVTVAGLCYFYRFGNLRIQDWALPWICLVFLTGVNLYISPRFAFVEGAGFPGKVAALRLAQTIAGYTALIAMLVGGLSLWATVALPLAQSVLGIAWLVRDRTVLNFFHREFRGAPAETGWRREILDLQWRVALSWVGGYLATLVFTPLLFAYQSPSAAGQWGLTFSLFSAALALGASWITARVPRFGELIARGDRATLDREFFGSTIKSTGLTCLICIGLVAAVAIANWTGIPQAHRVVTVVEMALMGLATVASSLVYCLAAYMRAHKEEPLVTSSLVIGALTVLSAFVGALAGIFYVALAYTVVTLIVNLPWRVAIYLRYRRRDMADFARHGLA